MNVLVANIGSTSFKYRLYAMPEERLLARGGVERIGATNSRSYVLAGGETIERIAPVPDHGAAVSACLEQLTAPGTGCRRSALRRCMPKESAACRSSMTMCWQQWMRSPT